MLFHSRMLRYLHEVARTGSIRQAARQLNVAASSMNAVGTCAAEALRYHTLVRALREVLARRVAVALATRVDYAVSAARRADTLA